MKLVESSAIIFDSDEGNFQCPVCGPSRSQTVDSRRKDVNGDRMIARRRKCAGCGGRFETYEITTEILSNFIDRAIHSNNSAYWKSIEAKILKELISSLRDRLEDSA